MLTSLPSYIALVFIGITALTFFGFLRSIPGRSRPYVAAGLSAWLLLQGILAYRGFYGFESAVPPRFMLMIAPPLGTVLLLFGTKGGRRWMDHISLSRLTWMNTVRVGVELVLFWLFV